ncbi:protein of unknown function UPF0153 [Magnetococcus marinus MC-1]|uniref:C2H2-type domain-containing protein n=1 Tax=Magnetococcus marinus (strain ATCC BAA-1437 / JCM 17883 / MC-1) TaxID=156889 RepID=A0LAK7_MAGMM|nr:YkgJ family cysteine cluster protein [Magnetococcus marinus]ABK45000.1 protein of unknown function UPF0153 [Magnetococcus marinus MC-1]
MSTEPHPTLASPDPMTPFDAAPNLALVAAQLCKGCGLCCSGSFFSYVTLHPHEQAHLTELGLPSYTQSNGEILFDHPCPRLKQGLCSIYAERPKQCQGYHCQLVKEIWMGTLTPQQGERIIMTAKQRHDWLIQQAKTLEGRPPGPLNLRTFLYQYYRHNKKRPLEPQERDFVRSSFEYLALIRRHFHETSILGKYAAWLQQLA